MSEAVILALSELRSLITKAGRGAGLSWGMAEEAGWAADWLARAGLPAADWAAVWLASRTEGSKSAVEVGVEFTDGLLASDLVTPRPLPDGVTAPGYLVPFLSRLATGQASVAVSSARGPVALVSADGRVEFGPDWAAISRGWSVAQATRPPEASSARASRARISGSVLDRLEGLALRTTVPQSEASRRDAGSMKDDND